MIPYGIDPTRFRPPTAEERLAARDWLGVTASVPVLGFIGALGDRRKGLDTLYDAWQRLPAGSLLVVAGRDAN